LVNAARDGKDQKAVVEFIGGDVGKILKTDPRSRLIVFEGCPRKQLLALALK